MANKYKQIVIACLFLIPSMFFAGCEKNFDDQDNDLIAGKWRNAATLGVEDAKETDFMNYMEFAPYNYVYDKRTYKTVTYEYDSTQAYPYLRLTRTGHYTLNKDTLTIKDYKLQTRKYIVLSIENNVLRYKDDKDSIYEYVRYDGAMEEGKLIQDVYNK
ncbi:MAG: hypothetical protein IJ759_06800 [Bacteroidales bacterium]|nr:hypothetical protein [Bacteroidales bacterium]